jgi:hypothetical protein
MGFMGYDYKLMNTYIYIFIYYIYIYWFGGWPEGCQVACGLHGISTAMA